MGGRSSASGMTNNREVQHKYTTVTNLSANINKLTADYTPSMFLGSAWSPSDTNNDLIRRAEDYSPQSLLIDGYTFNRTFTPRVVDESKNKTAIMIDYQSDSIISGEYPILQIGIRRTMRRKNATFEIICDGYQNKTRLQ